MLFDQLLASTVSDPLVELFAPRLLLVGLLLSTSNTNKNTSTDSGSSDSRRRGRTKIYSISSSNRGGGSATAAFIVVVEEPLFHELKAWKLRGGRGSQVTVSA